MNELLLCARLLLIFGCALIALKLGRESLMAWIAVQAVLANLFVLKQTLFFHVNATCSDVFAIGGLLGLNLLQEHFGKQSAKKALVISFFIMFFFTAMSYMHLLYAPSPCDTTHGAFKSLLSPSFRLFASSVCVFFITQKIDLFLFHLLKRMAPLLPFSFRYAVSTSLTQCVDTLLFTLFGLWGLISSFWDIFFISLSMKLLIIALLFPLVSLIKRLIPEKIPL